MTDKEKQYYALLDLFEREIHAIKENDYQQVDTNQCYKEMMSILNLEEEKKDE
jgi:hypothetical protein